jgi:cadmium resistance protein CadD (predicted permease)
MWFWTTIQVAFAAGLATTFDDNIYLTAFFGEVNRNFRPLHVVTGEIIGFTVLLSLSLVGYAVGMNLPSSTVGLLGILPIAIGIKNLIEFANEARQNERGSDRLSTTKTEPHRPHYLTGFKARKLTIWQVLRDRKTYDVALVSISNGSNNLSIYITLFASLTLAKIAVVIPVLYIFIFTWLALSLSLTRMPGISLALNRNTKVFFPFILMWLGYRILNDSGAINLWKFQG